MTADRPPGRRFELVDGPVPPATDDPAAGGPGRGPTGLPVWLAVAVSVLAVVVLAVVPPRVNHSAPAPTPPPLPLIPTPSTPTAGCDLADPACRITQASQWRDRTAAVVRSRLDPQDRYFTGYSYATSTPYENGSRLDALGLEVYRLEGGGTEVFVQIAKSRGAALRCGQLTRHRCFGQRFMDGNRFTLTPTTSVADGVEVQYSPSGTYVITLVARNTTAGRPLEIGIGDLIGVAQDPRLQPPPS